MNQESNLQNPDNSNQSPDSKDQNQEPTPEIAKEESELQTHHTLDPKVIHKLEMDILRTLNGEQKVDPLFHAELSDSGFSLSSPNPENQNFSMETMNVSSVKTSRSSDQLDENNGVSKKSKFCSCFKKAKISNSDGSVTIIEDAPPFVPNKNIQLLPPQAPKDKGKITLVLDLDETLVHSSFLAIPHADFRFVLAVDKNPVSVFVCIRPGTDRFLRELSSFYEIVVFTASSKIYADQVIDSIDSGKVIKHRLYRECCTEFKGVFVKDLSRLNRPLEKIIIVDNSAYSYMFQPYNAIGITSWFDDPTDNELLILLEFLKQHYNEESIYDVLVDE